MNFDEQVITPKFIKIEMIVIERIWFCFQDVSIRWTLIDLCHANETNYIRMHLDYLVHDGLT